MFSLHGSLVHPKCFQLCLSLVNWLESRQNLRCLHSDMKWWPLPNRLEYNRAATAFLCGFSTMEWPPYSALHVDSELQLNSHL